MSIVSRQRIWQIRNPLKAKLLQQQTKIRQRRYLLNEGYVKTHEEIWEIIDGYEHRNGKMSDGEWWLMYEYLDWKYNNGKLLTPVGQSDTERKTT